MYSRVFTIKFEENFSTASKKCATITVCDLLMKYLQAKHFSEIGSYMHLFSILRFAHGFIKYRFEVLNFLFVQQFCHVTPT